MYSVAYLGFCRGGVSGHVVPGFPPSFLTPLLPPPSFSFSFPFPHCFIVGHEVAGVRKELLDLDRNLARGYNKILRLSWTPSTTTGAEQVLLIHSLGHSRYGALLVDLDEFIAWWRNAWWEY